MCDEFDDFLLYVMAALDKAKQEVNSGSLAVVINVNVPKTTPDCVNEDCKSSGFLFDLKPQICEDENILSLVHQLSSFQRTDNINSPIMLKRELQTSVFENDDELIFQIRLDELVEIATSRGVMSLPDFLRGNQSENEATLTLLMLHVRRI